MLFRAKSGLSYKFYLLIKIYVTTFRKQFAPDLIFKSKIEGEGDRSAAKKIPSMLPALLVKAHVVEKFSKKVSFGHFSKV